MPGPGHPATLKPAKKGEIRNPIGNNGRFKCTFSGLVDEVKKRYGDKGALEWDHSKLGKITDPHAAAVVMLFGYART